MKKCPVAILFFLTLWICMILLIVFPKETVSSDENRTLAKFPKVTIDSFLDNSLTSDIQKYVDDHFPGRSKFVRIKNTFEQILGNSENNEVIYGKNHRMFRRMYKNDEIINTNTKAISNFADQIEGDRKIYMGLVPSAAFVYEKDLPALCKVVKEDVMIEEIYSQLEDKIDTIDFIGPLTKARKSNDANLYFKTDHHYTLYGATVVGNAILKKMCLRSDVTYKKHIQTMDGFYGSYFRRTPTYTVKSEKMDYLEYDNLSMKIYDETYTSLMDENDKSISDKYGLLLHGNNAKLTIVNKNCNNGKRLIVCKDSYFNILAPMIANQYEEVDVIDLRYYNESFVEYVNSTKGDVLLYFSLYHYDTENSVSFIDN